jgi:hypothetical protein
MGQQKKMAAATERGFRGKKKVLAATVRGPRQKQKVHAAMGQRKKMANKKRPVATGRGFRQEGKHLRPWANKKRWLRRLPGKQERASGHGEGFREQKNTCGHVPIKKEGCGRLPPTPPASSPPSWQLAHFGSSAQVGSNLAIGLFSGDEFGFA